MKTSASGSFLRAGCPTTVRARRRRRTPLLRKCSHRGAGVAVVEVRGCDRERRGTLERWVSRRELRRTPSSAALWYRWLLLRRTRPAGAHTLRRFSSIELGGGQRAVEGVENDGVVVMRTRRGVLAGKLPRRAGAVEERVVSHVGTSTELLPAVPHSSGNSSPVKSSGSPVTSAGMFQATSVVAKLRQSSIEQRGRSANRGRTSRCQSAVPSPTTAARAKCRRRTRRCPFATRELGRVALIAILEIRCRQNSEEAAPPSPPSPPSIPLGRR